MTESCKCAETAGKMYETSVTSNGTWTDWGGFLPSYTYSSGYHAPKCENCGYCKCCGKADIPGNLTGSPEQPDFIAK